MDGLKKDDIITDWDVYCRHVEEIKCVQLAEKTEISIQFALFRANLFNIGLGASVQEDLDLFNDYAKNLYLQHLQFSTFLPMECFDISFSNEATRQLYYSTMRTANTLIFNSFHFGAFPLLMNFLIWQGFDLFCLLTTAMLERHGKRSHSIVAHYNRIYQKDARLHFINADDISCILQLQSLVGHGDNRRHAIIVFADAEEGNRVAKSYIHLFNRKYRFSQNVASLAHLLQCPLVNCFLHNSTSRITIYIDRIFDVGSSLDGGDMSVKLFTAFEHQICRRSVSQWVNIYTLHHFIDTTEWLTLFNQNDLAGANATRFTIIAVDSENYLFDSKYYLAHYIPYRLKGTDRATMLKLIKSSTQ